MNNRRLTIDRISNQGAINLAAAILTNVGETYMNAKRAYESMRDAESYRHYLAAKQELRTTPWNLTGLTGDELIHLIETRWDFMKKQCA